MVVKVVAVFSLSFSTNYKIYYKTKQNKKMNNALFLLCFVYCQGCVMMCFIQSLRISRLSVGLLSPSDVSSKLKLKLSNGQGVYLGWALHVSYRVLTATRWLAQYTLEMELVCCSSVLYQTGNFRKKNQIIIVILYTCIIYIQCPKFIQYCHNILGLHKKLISP